MERFARRIAGMPLLGLAIAAFCAFGQDHRHPARPSADSDRHQHWMTELGAGWHVMGMAQLIPSVTNGAPGDSGSPLHGTRTYLTQPAAMLDFVAPDQRLVVRFTPNLEGIAMEDGERTFGAWGEGFIDSRHPHTYLHELVLSWRAWDAQAGVLYLSAGRGFAPFGTDDPMARPALKYPTNHHLSQILERWTASAQYLFDNGVSLEVGVFDGREPEHPGDAGNFRDFPNSWSTRIGARFGEGQGPMAQWELSASLATVREELADHDERTRLANIAVRHNGALGSGRLYALVEASRSRPRDGDGYDSILGELELEWARHRPYLRLERATRPEYDRFGPRGQDFFRYEHADHEIGSTRWTITTLGYGFAGTSYPFAARPFMEVQYHAVSRHRGPEALEPRALFGTSRFWSITAGVRFFFGADERMRMGSYGALDPMTHEMARAGAAAPSPREEDHGPH